jgi:lipopolysaccharide biosynthesis regulator YciM
MVWMWCQATMYPKRCLTKGEARGLVKTNLKCLYRYKCEKCGFYHVSHMKDKR